ncbi:hypothetical protein [Cellulomonas sp. ATA003]|uniref:hypothetical protein n=1 Tax=Cellulomonas sp. ATA003 TaxID=3073064 RepID=UPI002873C77D|nr:hypothetical protein [Cellulomonas sp. ATA003]WNB84990.1 hypothetical protein REH70_15050 [Cellulomonas sp. ATA003]
MAGTGAAPLAGTDTGTGTALSAGTASVAQAAAGRVRAGLGPTDRGRYDALVTAAATGGDAVASVPARALAGGASVDAIERLAALWPTLTRRERSQVSAPLGHGRPGPLRVGDAPARQSDGTTCGSTVLAMLAAAGDPFLALWLVTGRLVGGHVPLEARGVAAAELTSDDAAVRFAALQRALKRASTRGALGPLPWPAALGTPPWGAARVARWPGVRFTHHVLDDTDAGHLAAMLDRADTALAAGVPVPLFTGGDLGRGVTTAVPRHVVLLVPPEGRPARPDDDRATYAVLEPGQGRVHRITREVMATPGGPHPALGGWSHVCWALLPRT